MRTVLIVNDWKVEDDETVFVITNSSHPELRNTYYKSTNKYSCPWKRVPKTIDRKIKVLQGIVADTPSRSSRRVTRRTDSLRTFGIEIECFHPIDSNIASKIERKLNAEGIRCVAYGYTHDHMETWKITTDSSIRGGEGVEVVSPILKGEEGIQQVKTVMKHLSSLGLRVNKSTGMHVHIGARDLTRNQLLRCFSVYKNNEKIFDSLVAKSRRQGPEDYGPNGKNYCKSLINQVGFPCGRYFKLNYQSYLKYETLEFRQHQGSLNGDKAEHWIKLVRSVVEYAKNGDYTRFIDLSQMITYLGLGTDLTWYTERQEELA